MRTSIELPPEPRAASAARHFVAERLDGRVDGDAAEIVLLLTSELVTNAILHARTPLLVEIDVDRHVVHVGVADSAPGEPRPRSAGDSRMTGRGLRLVSTLANGWGVEAHPPGKTVWFEVRA